MPHVSKKNPSEMKFQFKQKTRPRMSCDWIGKTNLKKKMRSKKSKKQ